jgi:hypothetical protein
MTALKFDDETITAIAVRMAAEAKALLHPCPHDEISVRKTLGGGLDDHTHSYGDCMACGLWVVRTVDLSLDTVDTRPMTGKETDGLEYVEARYRREDAT